MNNYEKLKKLIKPINEIIPLTERTVSYPSILSKFMGYLPDAKKIKFIDPETEEKAYYFETNESRHHKDIATNVSGAACQMAQSAIVMKRVVSICGTGW